MIILEGPDGGGKTTLMNQLVEWLKEEQPVRPIHHGPYLEEESPFENYLASLLGINPVLDRSWLSEPIYGKVYRDGKDRIGPALRRMLDRVALARNGVVVVCRPSWETVRDTWAARKEEEYVKDEAPMRQIWEEYSDLPEQTDLPVIFYDRDDPDAFKKLVDQLKRHDYHLAPPIDDGYIGARHPRVVILGEKANSDRDLPFVKRGGCSPWLAELLEEQPILESSLGWFNVQSPDGRFKELPRRFSRAHLIAVGRIARAWCEHHGLKFISVPHPQYWKRFRSGERYPLINAFYEVL